MIRTLIDPTRFISNFHTRIKRLDTENAYRDLRPMDACEPGTEEWLKAAEKHFGGIVRNVERKTVSHLDPRTPEEIAKGGMTGGDRMFHHGYAGAYAATLAPFVSRRETEMTIIEVGILRGTGLALWSVLFPNARIIGLDIDVSHTADNLAFLKARGAFSRGFPELHRFDQLTGTAQDVSAILAGARIDICIDDGLHTDASIVNTARAIHPHLSEQSAYFVEDSYIPIRELHPIFGAAAYMREGRLTAIRDSFR